MLKKLVLLLAALVVSMSAAFAAAVDVNTADQAALESVKGLGPVKSKAIIDERTKGGPFKDANDLANRVKGLGVKSVTHLEAQGLTISGSSAPPQAGGAKAAPSAHTPTPAPSAAPAQPAAKPVTPAAASATGGMSPPASGAHESKSKKHKKSKASATSAASGA
jgi:competence ComEA-like helix-hairpin-helix protein